MSEYESANDSEDSQDSEPTRPNRFDGPSSTWLSLTEQERGLNASLTQLRDQDLSVHLYNAHALKTGSRAYEKLKEQRASQGIPQPTDEDEAQRSFKPAKSWTAWPLPPDIVPREGERVGPEDEDEIYTLKRRESMMPSRQLEDNLMGVTLKYAKERFEAREWNEEDIEEAIEEDLPAEKPVRQDAMDISAVNLFEDDNSVPHPILKQSSEAPPEKRILQPVVSADDDRSKELLRPSIRHTLSQLDKVLMALHQARRTCLEYSMRSNFQRTEPRQYESQPSGSEELTEKGKTPLNKTPLKRPVGRPRKHTSLPERPRMDQGNNSAATENPDLWRAKPTTRGRPRKKYSPLDGETEQDYIIRVARLQKKPLPAFAPPLEKSSVTRSASTSKKTRRRYRAPENATIRHGKHLALRDWSEVLGSAAIVGFSPDVIARASQRCANLFGEGMTMRTMIEAPVSAGNVERLDHYRPEMIPDLGPEIEHIEISSGGESSDSESGSSSSDVKTQLLGLHKMTDAVTREEDSLCPFKDCRRHTQGFSNLQKLRNHMRSVHKLTVDQMEDAIFGGHDELFGGVHVDGWLKPLQSKRGVRGKDTSPRKRTRWSDRTQKLGSGRESGSGSQSITDSSESEESLKSEESNEE